MNFEQKYLKYKAKYLELKNNLIGAGNIMTHLGIQAEPSDIEMKQGKRTQQQLEAYAAKYFPDLTPDNHESVIRSIMYHNVVDRHTYEAIRSSLSMIRWHKQNN
jgi:hypothetical protein